MSVVIHDDLKPYLVAIDTIHQHPDNPNSGDVELIAESILTNGFYNPVIVQASTGYILAGNHRYAAMLYLGQSHIPAVSIDVDDAAALKVLIADNRIAEMAERDPRALEVILKQLAAEETLVGTGYMEDDLADLMRLNRIADHAPLNPGLDYGGDSLPARSVVDVRVVVNASIDEDGRRHPITKEEAEELVADLREQGFQAVGEFLG